MLSNDLVKRVFCNFEECIVLLLNGNLLNLENDVIFCFTYISPEGSPIYDNITGRNGVQNFENKLFDIVSQYPDAGVVLAGDFNARCCDLQDITIDDNVDFIFDDSVVYESDNFLLGRNSKDKTCNTYGFSLIDMCKTYGVHFLNGRINGDNEGEITCVANDGSKFVDYVI